MDDPIINNAALRQPRNKQMLIIIGVAVLALLILFTVWRSTGTQGAKRDYASATERVDDKQREVDEARQLLDQRLAELRAVRAEADAEATKLGGVVDERIRGAVEDARVDRPEAPREYYVRNRDGDYVRVEVP